MLKAWQTAAAAANEASQRLSTSQPLLAGNWFPEELGSQTKAKQSSGPVAGPAFSITPSEDAGVSETVPTASTTGRRPATDETLERLCEEQRKALHAGQKRVVALEEEISQVKMKALKKLREQDTALNELRAKVLALEAEKTELRRDLSSDVKVAGTANGMPRSLTKAATPGTIGDDTIRVPMLQEKVKQQAADLMRQRAACDTAVQDVCRLQRRVDVLQQARLEAETETAQLHSERRMAQRCSTASQSRASMSDADILKLREQLAASVIDLHRAGVERDEAVEQASLLTKEAANLREHSAQLQLGEAARMEQAEAAQAAEADAKSARDQLASMRQKARELLEQKDADLAGLQHQLRRALAVPSQREHSQEMPGEAAGSSQLAMGVSEPIEDTRSYAQNGGDLGPSAVGSSASEATSIDVSTLHQYAALQARLESELQQERSQKQQAQRQLREATASLGQGQRNAVLQASAGQSRARDAHSHTHVVRPTLDRERVRIWNTSKTS